MTSKFKTLESDGKVLHVDVSVFTKATVAEQVAFISEKTKEGFTINMCEFPKLSISQINVLLTSYKANPSLTLVSLDNTLEVSTPEEKEVIENFKLALGVFSEAYEALTDLSKSKYPFATVPNGYSLDKNFKFLTQRVRRSNDSDHFLTNQDVKSLMNTCMDHWISGDKNRIELGRVSLQAHSYYRDITIDATCVRIGCQTIQRHELEQIAIRLGFKGEKFENVPKLK